MKRHQQAPKAVTDWISGVIDDIVDEKHIKVTDPKNLDIQKICPDFPREVPVFIEISKGSNNKYEWDVDLNIMMLDRVLSSAVYYPYDYGFVPQTLCEDGDPLDVLVIGSHPVIPGVLMKARPLGYLDFEDVDIEVDKATGEKREVYCGDQKVIAVSAKDPFYETWQTLEDVPPRYLEMIGEFFKNYKNLEKKTKLKPKIDKGFKDYKACMELIKETHLAFTKTVEKRLAARKDTLRPG